MLHHFEAKKTQDSVRRWTSQHPGFFNSLHRERVAFLIGTFRMRKTQASGSRLANTLATLHLGKRMTEQLRCRSREKEKKNESRRVSLQISHQPPPLRQYCSIT
jgi:hypothetical protein